MSRKGWVQLSIEGTTRAIYFPISKVDAVVEADPRKAGSVIVVAGEEYLLNETVHVVMDRIVERESDE